MSLFYIVFEVNFKILNRGAEIPSVVSTQILHKNTDNEICCSAVVNITRFSWDVIHGKCLFYRARR